MFTADNNRIENYINSRGIPRTAPVCLAPWTSVSFSIDGYATICCLNRKTTVPVSGKSIDEIWNCESFKKLRENISQKNLSFDCGVCETQIKAGNFSGVKASGYDSFFPYHPDFPVFMEFCLDNTCNLSCVMCNSLLSSSIRKKENLPPLIKYYDEVFIQQLNKYIPHLKFAVFSGGEPFLIPMYYKIWEKMIAMNPNLIIGVVTNGSTLNDRIKNLLEQGKFQLNISIDAVDKEIYESVRHDAGFDTLLCNFEWFKQYGIRHNLPVIVPVCPLVNNWENIPAVIRFANRNDVTVNFVYVDRPLSLSLPMQSAAFLENIISRYQSEVFEQHSASAKLNVNRFNDLIKDLTTWKKEAINAAPPLLFENARQILIEKISDWISNHGEGSSSESHQELIFKIEQILQALPETKRVKMLSVFNSYSPERIFQFINGKTVEELISFFKEYAGEKRL